MHSFYSILYTTTHNIVPNFIELDDIILPTLSNNEQQSCEGLLCENEILTVVNRALTIRALAPMVSQQSFTNTFGKISNALNFTYVNNKLSITQRGLIKNWRPITLLNQDYKLATKPIDKRICSMLPKLIHSDQTGFLKNRYIGENIIRITNIMDHLDQNNEAGLLLSCGF